MNAITTDVGSDGSAEIHNPDRQKWFGSYRIQDENGLNDAVAAARAAHQTGKRRR